MELRFSESFSRLLGFLFRIGGFGPCVLVCYNFFTRLPLMASPQKQPTSSASAWCVPMALSPGGAVKRRMVPSVSLTLFVATPQADGNVYLLIDVTRPALWR